jgi:hypothetical protein
MNRILSSALWKVVVFGGAGAIVLLIVAGKPSIRRFRPFHYLPCARFVRSESSLGICYCEGDARPYADGSGDENRNVRLSLFVVPLGSRAAKRIVEINEDYQFRRTFPQCVSFSESGRVALSSASAGVRVYDIASNKLVGKMPSPAMWSSVELSRDGSKLAVWGGGTGTVWHVDHDEILLYRTGAITRMRWSFDEAHLAFLMNGQIHLIVDTNRYVSQVHNSK